MKHKQSIYTNRTRLHAFNTKDLTQDQWEHKTRVLP